MSYALLHSPWTREFDQFLGSARSSITICSPFFGRGPTDRIINHISALSSRNTICIRVLTDLSRENIVAGSTDVRALLSLFDSPADVEVRFLPSLHAKVYIVDQTRAVVTSANFTTNGLARNIEYGVMFTETAVVRQIELDVLSFVALGSPIDRGQLQLLCTIADELRDIAKAAQRSISKKLRQQFEDRLAHADTEILRARAAGRTAHAIFAEAIRHLLRSTAMRTVDIHEHVKAIHPDLCDDSIDRVIDGQHFGKRWKHHVRSAQVSLQRRGEIELVNGYWQVARPER